MSQVVTFPADVLAQHAFRKLRPYLDKMQAARRRAHALIDAGDLLEGLDQAKVISELPYPDNLTAREYRVARQFLDEHVTAIVCATLAAQAAMRDVRQA